MDYAALKIEIEADPAGLGYAGPLAIGAHNQIAELLNAPRYAAAGMVRIDDLIVWAGAHAVLVALRQAAASEDTQIAGIAEAGLLIAANPNIPAVDLGRPDVAAMFDALVAGQVITQAARDELFGKATTQRSRAQQIGLGQIDAADVAQALSQEVPE